MDQVTCFFDTKKLSVCDQSEFSASLGVARLAMFQDNSIIDKKNIIGDIQVSKNTNQLKVRLIYYLKDIKIGKAYIHVIAKYHKVLIYNL